MTQQGVTWRVSPKIFNELHGIIAKHGMGLDIDDDLNIALNGYKRLYGPDAAATEILNKYDLRPGIPLNVVVDNKLDGFLKPEYEV